MKYTLILALLGLTACTRSTPPRVGECYLYETHIGFRFVEYHIRIDSVGTYSVKASVRADAGVQIAQFQLEEIARMNRTDCPEDLK